MEATSRLLQTSHPSTATFAACKFVWNKSADEQVRANRTPALPRLWRREVANRDEPQARHGINCFRCPTLHHLRSGRESLWTRCLFWMTMLKCSLPKSHL